MLNRFAVGFRRNGVNIEETDHIYKIDTGCSKTLIIKNISPDDGGKYNLETAGIRSKPANACNVIVKRKFLFAVIRFSKTFLIKRTNICYAII